VITRGFAQTVHKVTFGPEYRRQNWVRSVVCVGEFTDAGPVVWWVPEPGRLVCVETLFSTRWWQFMVAPIRIVVAKPGLDGHDRGAKVVARALRDAGNEVIYTGLHQTPEQIVETAIQEDADVIGLSVLSGAHMTLFKKLIALLDERDARDIVVFGGGIIPEDDIPLLEQAGVAKVFTPGATTTEIVAWVKENVADASGVEA
jgi:methylmalonyl-CoA mutase, C-terminal domain